MKNVYLKNAELVREVIEPYLPTDQKLDYSKLQFDVQKLIDSTKELGQLPISMTSVIANYTLANFVSQFHIRINLDGTLVPTNLIGFALVKSGAGKDSTVNAMEKALSAGYNLLEQYREDSARERAQERAEQEDDPSNWQKYFKKPMPLTSTISTIEGMVARLNLFARDGIGMPSIYTGELGSDLGSNPNMTDNIKLIAQLFDLGDFKSKAIKDEERQDQEVSGMGMCALFVGSEDNIIMDKTIAQKFRMEFVTKLARRCMFVYPTKEEIEECIINHNSYEQIKSYQEESSAIAKSGKAYLNSKFMDLTTRLLERDSRIIQIDDDAFQLFRDYKFYCNNLGEGLDFLYKSVQLEQTHRFWKMLKLAGVYAILDDADSISVDHIKQAIYFVEMIGKYLSIYEDYASKEEYELLLQYFINNPEAKLSLHELKKRGFITGTTNLNSKISELIRLADSLAGNEGKIEFKNEVMYFTPFERTAGNHGASFVKVTGTKEERAFKCHSGYTYKTTSFAKLSNLLVNDVAYTPFKFRDGKRSNDNIISGASWVALDVDDTDIDINEMHDILDGINHHIATTSNINNPYKYRILLEFNTIVDLPVREWKAFGKALGEELGIEVDPVSFTKSQIMFGYSGSNVLSCTDGDAYDVTNAIKAASQKVNEVIGKTPTISRTKKRSMLDNPLETFAYAFNDNVSARSLTLYRLWKHVKDLSGTADEAEKLMRDLNNTFWSNPISDERLESYIAQMRRAYEQY